MKCQYCGEDNPEDARFCWNCGLELSPSRTLTPSPKETPEVAPVSTPRESHRIRNGYLVGLLLVVLILAAGIAYERQTASNTNLITSITSNYSLSTSPSGSCESYAIDSQPSLRSSCWNYVSGGPTSVSCTLPNVVSGDELLAILQSSGVGQGGTMLQANDSALDSFSYYTNWNGSWGVGSAYAKASSSGSTSLTLKVQNGGAGLSMFCYDIANVQNSIAISQGNGTAGTLLSTSPLSTSPNSFVIAIYVSSPQAGTTFTAGPGFTLIPGSPISGLDGNTVTSEYAVVNSASTTCPIASSIPQYWGGLCYAFPPS